MRWEMAAITDLVNKMHFFVILIYVYIQILLFIFLYGFCEFFLNKIFWKKKCYF